MITISVIKADIGGFVGHGSSHPQIIETAKKELKKSKLIIDYYVTHCGDDLELILTHRSGVNNKKIHNLGWNIFLKCEKVAKKLKLYGIGQDIILKDKKGMGIAEMSFKERESEPILIFMGDKCSSGVWNLPLYKMFADPFNTPGLIFDKIMKKGFIFDIMNIKTNKIISLKTPEQIYDILSLIRDPSTYIIKTITRKDGEITACSTHTSLNLIANKYIGKDDPALIVRVQKGLPAVGEALEAFTFPFLTEGWMRGIHNGPIMPVSLKNAKAGRFDGPTRIICLGFQLSNGKLIGPRDMFDDVSFDKARKDANYISDFIRKHGPFRPHTISNIELRFTDLPTTIKNLEKKSKK